MSWRDVQGGKVVVVGLDLGPFGDAVAQSDEEIDELVYEAHGGMQAPLRVRSSRKSYVHGLRSQTLLALGGGYRLEPSFEGGFDLSGSPVRSPADLATVLGGEIPNTLLHLG